MKKTILIVDDEQRIRNLIADFLKKAEYDILEASDGEMALDKIFNKKNRIDLVILDVMLPKFDGWFILEKMREVNEIPVIMLTARDEESEQLKGFRLGANDYICKPFSPGVLVARVGNILKTVEKTEDTIVFQKIEIFDYAREIKFEGKVLETTPKEYELIKYLIANKGVALSREKILNAVWNYDYLGDLRTVDTHIKQIRAKLKDMGKNIKTVRNIGYKLVD